MQFTKIASIIAMASAAIAAPALNDYSVEPRTGSNNNNNEPVCSTQGHKQVCCNGLLSCAVQVLGSNCNANSYCCKTDAPTGALINVALLNCVDIL
ncbi:hydrophobin 3 precursor [Fusarium beomiforme]|uniref:Hydrophobin 3 n=1 Tax=Fusarium beomiforme TaxID=44412 RepID=A0A9P5AGR9_9HYPO|nr:hydrophobin 3 precursor [Fusarium beomiforme]